MDKKALLESLGYQYIWENIVSGECVFQPHYLFTFILLTFADLKNYKFIHWYGAPCIIPTATVTEGQSLFPRGTV